jgi:tyrosinase
MGGTVPAAWRSRLATIIVSTLVLVAVGVTNEASATAPAPEPQAEEVRVRKNVLALSPQERRDFVDAILALKRTPSPFDTRLNWYDQFVAWHVALAECDPADILVDHQQLAHAGPMFLPWHRQYLLLFEDALRTVSGKEITVPYWDWTNHGSVSSVFADDFMGGNGDPLQGNVVTTGPFRRGSWHLAVDNHGVLFGTSATDAIVRNFGGLGTALPNQGQVNAAFAAPHYDVAPYDDVSDPAHSFRNALEGYRNPVPISLNLCAPDGAGAALPVGESMLHNGVHIWVGGAGGVAPDGVALLGTMSVPLASPNDPVFFLHHANVDRLWSQWQERHGFDTYQPVAGVEFNNRGDAMRPFDRDGIQVTPAMVDDMSRLGYHYDDSAAELVLRCNLPSS